MTAEEIQDILATLHNSEDHTAWGFTPRSGDPWSGYTSSGYDIVYYPATNTYTWQYVFDNGFTSREYSDAFEISEADLIAKLEKWDEYHGLVG